MSAASQPALKIESAIEPPPFLKTWPQVYRMVVAYLAVLLTALYLITKAFHY